ncbi:MAG TPA: glycoside hydrolase family 127 protein [Verrucomicrobiota bacterium]|nr:glycoside hydrolase family 127 protein [Verrucomicrobiota bacterium]
MKPRENQNRRRILAGFLILGCAWDSFAASHILPAGLTLPLPKAVQLDGPWGAALARGVQRLALDPYTSEEWLLADITDRIRRYPNNYSGDVPGRYIELAILTSAGRPFSPPLVSNVLAALPALQKPDGHFGVDLDLAKPTDATSPLYPMLWGNSRLLIGLPVAARATGDPRLWEAARRLGDFYVNSAAHLCAPAREAEFRATGTYGVGYTCCYFPAIEGLAWLYRDTGDERYLRQAERMAEVFRKFDALPIDHSHGNLCAWRGILALYEIAGKQPFLTAAQAKWDQAMRGGYVWPLGGIGEHFYKDYPGDEGCSESDWLRFNLELWRFTGECRYLEMAERLLRNQYAANQCANGGYGWRNFDGDGVGPVATRGKVDEWNVCCNFHGPLGLHSLKGYLAAATTNRILVNFFADFSAPVRVGSEEWRVTVRSASSGLPAEKVFDLTLTPQANSAIKGPLLGLRIPSWAAHLEIRDSAGRKVPLNADAGYAWIDAASKVRRKLRVVCRADLAVENRGFQRVALKPGPTSRLDEVVLTLGPDVLLAAPAVGQGRPTLLMLMDESGRLSAPIAEKGRLYTWRLPHDGRDKAQLPAAIACGTPVALRAWTGLDPIRRAAFVCDLVVAPGGDLSRAARKALREQVAAVDASLTGPFYGRDLDRQSDLWAAPAGWLFTSEGLRIEGGELGLFLGELTDYRLEFDLVLPAQGDGITGWIVRARDANHCLMFQVQSADSPFDAPQYKTLPNTLRPHVRRNGVWTVLDPVPLPRRILRGETHRYRVDCRGPRIEVFLDGERVHVQTDAGFSRGTIGLRAASPGERGLFRRVELIPLADEKRNNHVQ